MTVLGVRRFGLGRFDYLYVANRSLWTDLKILLRTIPHVLNARSV